MGVYIGYNFQIRTKNWIVPSGMLKYFLGKSIDATSMGKTSHRSTQRPNVPPVEACYFAAKAVDKIFTRTKKALYMKTSVSNTDLV